MNETKGGEFSDTRPAFIEADDMTPAELKRHVSRVRKQAILGWVVAAMSLGLLLGSAGTYLTVSFVSGTPFTPMAGAMSLDHLEIPLADGGTISIDRLAALGNEGPLLDLEALTQMAVESGWSVVPEDGSVFLTFPNDQAIRIPLGRFDSTQ